MVHCLSCNKSFHAGCLNTKPDEYIVQKVHMKDENNESLYPEIYLYKDACVFCRNEHQVLDKQDPCPICNKGDYMTAKILSSSSKDPDLDKLDQIKEVKKCHLICAMFNPKYKILSIEPQVFIEDNDDQYAEVFHKCSICKTSVVNGIECQKDDCKDVVHLRCALKQRMDLLHKNRLEIIDEGIAYG